MTINIKSAHVSLTPDIKDYIEKRLRSMDRLVDLDSPNVQLSIEIAKSTHHKNGEVYTAEIKFDRGVEHRFVSAEGFDVNEAIDKAKDSLAQEIKSGKDKKKSLFRRGAARVKNILRFNRDEN